MTESMQLADIVTDADPGFASGADTTDGVVQLRMNNVASDGALDWSDLRRVPADEHKRRRYRLVDEDIVFNSTNSPELVGKTAIFSDLGELVLFSNHFLRLRVDRRRADPRFVARWLNFQWQQREFERICTRWVNQAAVRKDDLLELRLALPTLPEQNRLSALLDHADRLRRTRRYALEVAETLLPAAFIDIFGADPGPYPISQVEELAADKPNAIRTGPFGSQLLHSEFTAAGIAVLGIDNVVKNRFEWVQRRYITPAKYERLTRYTVYPGDVLVTIMGTCGRCAIVPADIGTAINTKHLCCITVNPARCLPTFLRGALLYHPYVQRQLRVATKGAIMAGLNMEIIKTLRVPVPPLLAQEKFSSLVKGYERLRAVQSEALRDAEDLFDFLLHDAFKRRPEAVDGNDPGLAAPGVRTA